MARPVLAGFAHALDEARFGPARTLDLRTHMPTVAEAVRRADPWLRERQMARAREVLIITGRGRGSPGGHEVVRSAIMVLLAQLKRRGVIVRVTERNPGAFVAELAPIRALFETPPRSRDRVRHDPLADPAELGGLDDDVRRDLRLLAEYSLAELGVPLDAASVTDEMRRQFGILSHSIGPQETDREGRVRFLIAASRAAFEEDA